MPRTTTAPVEPEDCPDPSVAPASYEAAMAVLETLVANMESGALPLEASLAAYRRGAELVRYCRQSLERVAQQVKVLEGDALKALTGEPSSRTDNNSNGADFE